MNIDRQVKEALEKQLQLLSERSHSTDTMPNELVAYSEAMAAIAKLLIAACVV